MSTRTVVEINHDYLTSLLEQDAINLRAFISALTGTPSNAKEWCPTGVRFLAQRHHMDPITLRIE